jgi:hypothetical protein
VAIAGSLVSNTAFGLTINGVFALNGKMMTLSMWKFLIIIEE